MLPVTSEIFFFFFVKVNNNFQSFKERTLHLSPCQLGKPLDQLCNSVADQAPSCYGHSPPVKLQYIQSLATQINMTADRKCT